LLGYGHPEKMHLRYLRDDHQALCAPIHAGGSVSLHVTGSVWEPATGAYKENVSLASHWWPGELSSMGQDSDSVSPRSCGTWNGDKKTKQHSEEGRDWHHVLQQNVKALTSLMVLEVGLKLK